jgi:transposase-like protein
MELLVRLRHSRYSQGIGCPRCGATRVQRWGSFSGRQRFRCCACRRTFSDLTGTPAAYSKKLGLWPHYARCMAEGMSVRRSARRTGVCTSTSFRWRHAILDPLRQTGAEPLVGWIEVGSVTFAYSQKGARRTYERPRRRAVASRAGFMEPRVGVTVACDRSDHVVTCMAGRPRPMSLDLENALAGRLRGPPTLLAAHGRYGPASVFVHRHGGHFIDVRVPHHPGGSLVHARTVRDYIFRLLDWMDRFRGVATKYLPNYLAWHCRLDRVWREAVPRALLRWPLPHGFG